MRNGWLRVVAAVTAWVMVISQFAPAALALPAQTATLRAHAEQHGWRIINLH
jgi:hypothetical protein